MVELFHRRLSLNLYGSFSQPLKLISPFIVFDHSNELIKHLYNLKTSNLGLFLRGLFMQFSSMDCSLPCWSTQECLFINKHTQKKSAVVKFTLLTSLLTSHVSCKFLWTFSSPGYSRTSGYLLIMLLAGSHTQSLYIDMCIHLREHYQTLKTAALLVYSVTIGRFTLLSRKCSLLDNVCYNILIYSWLFNRHKAAYLIKLSLVPCKPLTSWFKSHFQSKEMFFLWRQTCLPAKAHSQSVFCGLSVITDASHSLLIFLKRREQGLYQLRITSQLQF